MTVFARICSILAIFCGVSSAPSVAAQERPAPALELGGGWAGFVDESLVNHSTLTGAARMHLTPRISVGPELTYMIGPGSDRDLFLLGNFVFDFLSPPSAGSRRAVPFLVVGGGLFHHRNRFGSVLDTHSQWTLVGGGGVRIPITSRFYVAPDVRLGVEDLHLRTTVNVGLILPR